MVGAGGGADDAGMPNYRRHFEPGRSVFLTLVTDSRRPWLRDADVEVAPFRPANKKTHLVEYKVSLEKAA